MKIEVLLEPIAYSPVTFEEADFYCNDYKESLILLNKVHRYDRTPEEALREMGLFPKF